MAKGLRFELSAKKLEVCLTINGAGNAEHLSYRSGEEMREFSGEEITVAVTEEGTHATVMLESGATDGPIVRFTVIVPAVIGGDETSFKVSAAALRTTQRSGFRGPHPGPQQSYEALTLTGMVSLMPADGEVGTCHDWYASHDHMPPGPKTLSVTGTCTFPTSGYSVKLRRHEPQGINPMDLLLDKIVTPPTGPVLQVITNVAVRYEEITDVEYDTVTILPGGPSITVVHPR
jgi:hypothetical protein